MNDSEIFKKWIEKSIAKHVVKENSQIGYMIEFAKFYHKIKLKENKEKVK
jgi:hypothetical protein